MRGSWSGGGARRRERGAVRGVRRPPRRRTSRPGRARDVPTSDLRRRRATRKAARERTPHVGASRLVCARLNANSMPKHSTTHARAGTLKVSTADRRSDTTQEACSPNVRGRARLVCSRGTSHVRAVPALAGCARLFSEEASVVAAGAGAAFLVHANQLLSACGCTWRPCRRAPRPRRQPV